MTQEDRQNTTAKCVSTNQKINIFTTLVNTNGNSFLTRKQIDEIVDETINIFNKFNE